jgi:hypothetical protein
MYRSADRAPAFSLGSPWPIPSGSLWPIPSRSPWPIPLRSPPPVCNSWGAEDGIRFWKQSTGIEDLRVRNYQSIRRLALLSMIACGLQAWLLLTRPSLARRIIESVKVFIPSVPFLQYRLWRGIRDALLAEA